MDCCPKDDDGEAGYALPAALVLSLALAAIAAGMLSRSMITLRVAREDRERLRLENGLDSAQLLAAAAIVSSQNAGPYRWAADTDVGPVDIVAEDENSKLGFADAAALANSDLERFGVQDVAGLKGRLSAAALQPVPPMTAELDSAPLWKICAPAVISPLGQGQALQYTTPGEPGPGPLPESWHIGEVWRLRVATASGWRDERLVRFTGDAQRPAATVVRRLYRTTGDRLACEELFSDWVGG